MRVKVEYTNYRGETSVRNIIPVAIWFGKTEHHPEPQWMLRLWDLDKGADRDYAMSGIKTWGVQDE